jgi:hypothetical protein
MTDKTKQTQHSCMHFYRAKEDSSYAGYHLSYEVKKLMYASHFPISNSLFLSCLSFSLYISISVFLYWMDVFFTFRLVVLYSRLLYPTTTLSLRLYFNYFFFISLEPIKFVQFFVTSIDQVSYFYLFIFLIVPLRIFRLTHIIYSGLHI